MRASQTLLHTLREDPGDALTASHRLLLRAGLAYKLGAGLYHLLPLGLRSFRKIEAIVRSEMDQAGALEIQAPILIPAELWQRSGRWDAMGKELFRLQDRHANWNALGPTHEESFSELFSNLLRSHKDLPKNIYQIHTKFRDEIRPRFGMIRAREFVMKDAYSFHLDEECLEKGYQTMRRAYRRIFARLDLDTLSVEADTGSMGGQASEEFMVPAEIGEEVLLVSEDGRYRSNQEKTPVIYEKRRTAKLEAAQDKSKLKKIHTPKLKNIIEVAKFLKTETDQILKAVLYMADQRPVLVFLRGDREVNEVKLKNHLKSRELCPASLDETKRLKLAAGFMGPLGIMEKKSTKEAKAVKGAQIAKETKVTKETKLSVLWDHSVKSRDKFVIGANEKDYHYMDYVPDPKIESQDLALARAGDPVPSLQEKDEGKGEGKAISKDTHILDDKLREIRGIEVGHIFKLGRKYSEAFGMKVLNEKGREVVPWMGCYGIGINRTLATIIEQHHDEKGIRWPIAAAPFEVLLISISKSAEENQKAAAFYEALLGAGCDVLWDDRDLRPGVKFADAELIGFPIRITMGKHYFSSGVLELQLRASGKEEKFEGDLQGAVEKVLSLKAKLYQDMPDINEDRAVS